MAPAMQTRHLGKGGPEVPALGLGLMGLSVFYGKKGTDEERLDFLDKAYANGATFWDSADVYGDNETLLGKWFETRGKRKDIFLATKFSQKMVDGKMQIRNDEEYIRECIESSLKKLKTDYIDLWYVHRFNGKEPVENVVEVMAEYVKAGKVKYIGLSEVSAETLRRAVQVHPIAAVQIEYSPFTVDIEHDNIGLLKTARELGVSIVAYSPLGRGMLTGDFQKHDDLPEGDFRRVMPRYSAENFPKNLELVHKLDAIAKKKGCTSSQLTLAWLLAQGPDVIPIPGTKKEKYLQQNLGALNVHLTADEAQQIRDAVDNAEPAGTRYPAAAMGATFADTPKP